jgi:hypothetical protein
MQVERLQRLPDGQMDLRIEAAHQRELQAGDVRLREHELERHEHPMIQTALRVERGESWINSGRQTIAQ